MKVDASWYLRGIISSSFIVNGVCDVSKYSVYTNVAMYSEWIKEIIKGTGNSVSSSHAITSSLSQPQRNSNNLNLRCTYVTLEFEPTRILKGAESVKAR